MKTESITILLGRVKNGEKQLLNKVYSQLYFEIKEIAAYQIDKLNTGETITPTVLAHDCYIKLLKQNKLNLKNSKHFLNCLSISMRQLLVDEYRAKLSSKRQHIEIDKDFGEITGDSDIDFKIIELDMLLNKINAINATFADVLNYKLILAMTYPEISKVLNKSERQVIRIWNQAKALLVALSKSK